MNSENQKGLIGTIIFHGLLFLCVFLMSFSDLAGGGGGGGGNNSIGEALGGLEVSLGEPDLGGNDAENGYTDEQPEPSAEEPPQDESLLTEDDAQAPILPSKDEEIKPKTPVVAKPKITAPVYKPTKQSVKTPEKKIDSKGLFKKGGNKGDGSKPGNEGKPDGTVFGDKDGNNKKGDGDGGPGNGPGNGPGDGPGKGPGSGNSVKFDLSGFRRDKEFNIETNRSGSGTVIIEICVYKDGRLKSARPLLGGTMTDKYFIDLALRAVKENTYSPTANSSTETCGKVKFTFKTR